MLRTLDKKYEFAITRIIVVNHGTPFLRVICENVQINKVMMQDLKSVQKWEIEGGGNQFKTKTHPVVETYTHAPDDIGVAIFTYNLVTELYFPVGEREINFGPIPPTPLPMPNPIPLDATEVNIPGLTDRFQVTAPFHTPTQRDFDNLDLDE